MADKDEYHKQIDEWMAGLLKCMQLKDWLWNLWPHYRYWSIDFSSTNGIWYWTIPDYERGRTRVLGIEQSLLISREIGELRQILDNHGFRERVDVEGLLLSQGDKGEIKLQRWDPQLEEAWFEDPRGGYFIARVTSSKYSTEPPTYLSLDAETWSAMGPENPDQDPSSYSLDELLEYVPVER